MSAIVRTTGEMFRVEVYFHIQFNEPGTLVFHVMAPDISSASTKAFSMIDDMGVTGPEILYFRLNPFKKAA